mmetsp:Transcript_94534/g.167996  ORF Transcript_94534/g.167996 Transcript_94534/m.167996 type:complete len:570 (+) Transcript_94534:69-1778(+)
MPSVHIKEDISDEDVIEEMPKKQWQEMPQRATRHSLLGGGPVFIDADAMKMKVKQALEKPSYNVFDYYWNTGFFQNVARSPIFEAITLAVIGINALWIWIDTDYNDADSLLHAELPFFIMENIFCTYFTIEWFVRFMAFERKRSCCRDYWFIFDSFLVAVMIFETWVMTGLTSMGGEGVVAVQSFLQKFEMLRLVRLMRLARLARMLRSMPELMILIKGMVAATRSVTFVMILLVLLMYMFAIAMKQLAEGTVMGHFYFPTVVHSMYSLMLYGTFLDNLAQFCDEVGNDSLPCLTLVFAFLFLAACTVLNMLIGILCDMVTAVASVEKELMTVDFVTGRLQSLLMSLDQDSEQRISKGAFMNILEIPEAAHALEEVGVDPVSIIDFADSIFGGKEADKNISFDKFMEELLNLRQDNSATIKDMVGLRNFMNEKTTALQKSLSHQYRKAKKSISTSSRPLSRGPTGLSRGSIGQQHEDGSMRAAIEDLQTRTGRIESTVETLMAEIRHTAQRLSNNNLLPGQVPEDVKNLPRARVLNNKKNHGMDNNTPKKRSGDLKKGHGGGGEASQLL